MDPSVDVLIEAAAGSDLRAGASDLLLAAALGEAALASALTGAAPPAPAVGQEETEVGLRDLFLTEIAVEGFRGIAGKARIGLRPGPGLTLVVGRNGCGKSTFAEAAELALTGTSSRWSGSRSKVWSEGWANFHYKGVRSVEVRLAVEGAPGNTAVVRQWADDAELEQSTDYSQAPGQPRRSVAALGLAPALATWRPFLPYNELGALLDDGPSKLYDAISAALGLDEWIQIEKRMSDARRSLEKATKETREEADRLRGTLEAMEDDRATAALAALPKRKAWQLDTLRSLSTGGAPRGSDAAALQTLASMTAVDPAAAEAAAAELAVALADVAELAGTDAGRARELADLLRRAVTVHSHRDDQACPVCGTSGVLDEQWVERSEGEIRRLDLQAASAESAHWRLQAAHTVARGLIVPVPEAVRVGAAGVDTAALATTWAAWAAAPEEAAELKDHLGGAAALAGLMAGTRSTAQEEVQRRADAWTPVAAQMAAWLPAAQASQARQGRIDDLKAAASWLTEETVRARNDRFAPIADRVTAIWAGLRQSSSVTIEGVTLEGTANRRRVEVSVSVDESPGAALAVMSQGELHALALSLFIPRATMDESPFRFVVIDDPVQSMDAARVDGLARTLAAVAVTHQVVVFTHDARLPDATRRLGLAAGVLEVDRSEHSIITVRARSGPVEDNISDALAVLKTDNYPEEARRRVVPGLCRNAVEAACAESTWRRLLEAGQDHADIEAAIEAAGKLLPRMALALFSDASRAGDVMAEVNRRWGAGAGDCIKALNTGAHSLINDRPEDLVRTTERVALALADLK